MTDAVDNGTSDTGEGPDALRSVLELAAEPDRPFEDVVRSAAVRLGLSEEDAVALIGDVPTSLAREERLDLLCRFLVADFRCAGPAQAEEFGR